MIMDVLGVVENAGSALIVAAACIGLVWKFLLPWLIKQIKNEIRDDLAPTVQHVENVAQKSEQIAKYTTENNHSNDHPTILDLLDDHKGAIREARDEIREVRTEIRELRAEVQGTRTEVQETQANLDRRIAQTDPYIEAFKQEQIEKLRRKGIRIPAWLVRE